ncbi:ABC transporter substrate-binding protein [Candidatus Colwellia aromaticivorans]|uniref:ABC transporter substrate-binding protein n=1 Tax=Candidatus Colwellia aromaticivorans TaxID=2267621 RepID=UPI0014443EAF|nr:ABC transporter substrate-binding protein [Candidatus Colwellia aromaticivorans]
MLAVSASLVGCNAAIDIDKALEGHLKGPAKIYRHSLAGAPSSLDPVNAATVYANNIVVNIYDTLYRYKYLARPYEIVPNLAVAMPEVSDDGLIYTIKIKKGVFYADDPAFPSGKGREVIAEDLIYSIKRHFDVTNRSQGSWLWDGKIVGIKEWKDVGSHYSQTIEGLKALDSHTIQITLLAPYPQLIHTFAQGFSAIVPHEAIDHYGREFSVHPVGSGPFKMLRYESSNYALMIRNIKYRQEPIDLEFEGYDPKLHKQYGIDKISGKSPPLVDALKIDFIKETASRWASFNKANEINFTGVPVEQVDQILSQKRPKIILTPEMDEKYHMSHNIEAGFVHTDFNMRDPLIGYNDDPVRDKRNKLLRCAIRSAFNWQERNDVFYSGIGIIYPGIIPPVVPEFDPQLSNSSTLRNVDEAKRLMLEGGWTSDNVPTLVYGGVASVGTRQMYEQFRGWMKDIGFPEEKVSFDSYASFGDFNKSVKEAKIMIIGMGWGLDYPDAQNTLQLFYGPYGSPGSNNSNYNNLEYNRLYEQTSVMQPSSERTTLYREMNNMVIDECVSMTGISRDRILLWHKNVVSYADIQIVGGFHLKFVDMLDEEDK